jgi:hypothetical protein
MADITFYFLVTGRTHNNGFGGFAHKLAVEILVKLVRGKAPGTARFIHFDFWNNKVEVGDFTPTKASSLRLAWTALTGFNPPEGAGAEDPRTFVDNNGHSLDAFEDGKINTLNKQFSITNVYHSVRGAPPGSVVAVMFISHGFADGPVLINSHVSPPIPFNNNQQFEEFPLVSMQSVDTSSGTEFDVKVWDSFLDPLDPDNNLPKRWPEDGDGRVDGDFAANMGEDPAQGGIAFAADGITKLKDGGKDALTQFKAAFNKTVVPGLGFAARIGILGCNVQETVYESLIAKDEQGNDVRKFVRQTLKSTVREVFEEASLRSIVPRIKGTRDAGTALGKQILNGTITDEQSLNFDLSGQFQNEAQDTTHYTVQDQAKLRALHFSTDGVFFGAPPPTSTQMQTTWGDLVKFVARQTVKTYQFQAAKVLEVEVLSTPPGTSGEIDEKKAPDKMVACGDNDRCTTITKLFSKYLGLPASQDGYSLFDKTSVGSIEQNATP